MTVLLGAVGRTLLFPQGIVSLVLIWSRIAPNRNAAPDEALSTGPLHGITS